MIKGNPLSTRNPMYIKPGCELLEAIFLGEVGRVLGYLSFCEDDANVTW